MKKVLFLASLALATCNFADAQKANVRQAENLLILKKFDDAKKAIDEAMQHEKTQDLPETYLVAAEVYTNIAPSAGAECFTKAQEFVGKAIKLDEEGGPKGKKKFKALKDIMKKSAELAALAEKLGADAWGLQNYGLSRDAFLAATFFNTKTENYVEASDTVFVLNAGLASMQAQDYKTGAECMLRASKFKCGGPLTVLRANYCYSMLKDSANMEAVLKAGVELYPNATDIINTLINLYLGSNRNDDALNYINAAIQKDPSNPQYYFARGCIYEKQDVEKAIADYNKSVELDPKLFNAYYNLAIVYYNRGLEMRTAASSERDPKIYDAKMAEAKSVFSGPAKGFMEKAVTNAPDKERKLDALRTLRTIAYQVSESYYEEVSKQYNEVMSAQ